jgi:peptidoglycan/LPS O-acetylase OafA/YrhL
MLPLRMNMQGANHSARKNLDIEVLRAIAVLMVLIDHVELLIYWNGSIASKVHVVTSLWGGVDIFFCISGFVITSLFLRQPPVNLFTRFSLPFWVRRIYRIWPSAIVNVLVVLAFSVLVNKSGAFGPFVGNFCDAVSVIMQVANFHWYHCFEGQTGGNCGVNTVYWSLSLEEQFYLAFPFLFFFLSRVWLARLLIGVVAIQFFLRRPPHSFLWEIRVDALAWGALIALAVGGPLHKLLEPRFLASGKRAVLSTLLFSGLIASLGTNQIIWFQTGPIALLSAVLIWSASYDKGYVFRHGRLRPFLLWAGSRSYAIYLVHPFAAFATRELFFRLYKGQAFDDQFLLRFLLVGLSLTFVLAEANYRFLEMPLRRKGIRLSKTMAEHVDCTYAVPRMEYSAEGTASRAAPSD